METPAPDPTVTSTSSTTPSAPASHSLASESSSAGSPIETVFEAIASPVRRSILDALRDGAPRTAAQLAAAVDGLSASSASRHLRVLRDAELVAATKVGRSLHYTISIAPLETIHRAWLSAFLPAVAEPAPAPPEAEPGAVSDERDDADETASEPELEHEPHDDPGAPDESEPEPESEHEPHDDPGAADEPEPRTAQDLVARISRRLGSMPRDQTKRPEPRFPSALVDHDDDEAATRRPFARLGHTEH